MKHERITKIGNKEITEQQEKTKKNKKYLTKL